MKKLFMAIAGCFFIACMFLFIGSDSKVTETPQTESEIQRYVPNEILVKFKVYPIGDLVQSRGLIQNIIDSVQGKIKTYKNQEINTSGWEPSIFAHRSFIGDPYLFHIKIPDVIDLDNAILYLQSNPYVEYAEKNAITYLNSTEPNDEEYENQWSLDKIWAPYAWDISTGNSEIVVAVLDTGIDTDHEDLEDALWTNPNEDPEDEEDNDSNGFLNDINGWNFVSDNNEIEDDQTHHEVLFEGCRPYPAYHGTHVSGIIGAIGNNTKGISGVCWNVKIMPVKIGDYCGIATQDRAINGIDYAISNGAFLLNMCYSFKHPPQQSLQEAVTRALKKGRLIFVSAGNDSSDVDLNENEHVYPACFTHNNIIGVLNTHDGDGLGTSTNYGEDSIDLGAPGEAILSTKPIDIYRYASGTSQATPHVSGVAALALGVCPGLTYGSLRNLILTRVDEIGALEDKCVTGGRLNAYKVLNALTGSTTPNAPSNFYAFATAWKTIKIGWKDNSYNELGFEIQRKDNHQTIFNHENCANSNSSSYAWFNDETIEMTAEEKTYSYRIRATNRSGISAFSNTASASIPYTVPEDPTYLQGESPTFYPLVEIYWNDIAANELYYFVERRISEYGYWQEIATLGRNCDSYNDSTAQAGNTYDYRVRAWNPLGYSGYSNIVTIEVIVW